MLHFKVEAKRLFGVDWDRGGFRESGWKGEPDERATLASLFFVWESPRMGRDGSVIVPAVERLSLSEPLFRAQRAGSSVE